jgi:hypothetical protein
MNNMSNNVLSGATNFTCPILSNMFSEKYYQQLIANGLTLTSFGK